MVQISFRVDLPRLGFGLTFVGDELFGNSGLFPEQQIGLRDLMNAERVQSEELLKSVCFLGVDITMVEYMSDVLTLHSL